MDRETYNNTVEHLIEKTRETLIKKNAEYANGSLPLHNFHKSAHILRSTPKEAALSFMTKHITSVVDMVQSKKTYYDLETWEEKLGDMINYCVLIYCLEKEEQDKWQPMIID